jgi:hypothetical protein
MTLGDRRALHVLAPATSVVVSVFLDVDKAKSTRKLAKVTE